MSLIKVFTPTSIGFQANLTGVRTGKCPEKRSPSLLRGIQADLSGVKTEKVSYSRKVKAHLSVLSTGKGLPVCSSEVKLHLSGVNKVSLRPSGCEVVSGTRGGRAVPAPSYSEGPQP